MTTYHHIQMATKVQKQTKKASKKVDGEKFVKQAEKKSGDINAPTNYWRHFDMKRFWIILGVTLGLFVILLILSSTVDFQISWGLAESKFATQYDELVPSAASYYSNNAWDNLIESFGDAPGFLLCMFGLWLMAFPFFFVDKGKRTWYRTTAQVIIPIWLILTAIWIIYYYNFYLGFHDYLKIVGGNTKNELNYFIAVLFSLVFNGLAFVIIFKFRQTTRISLAKIGALFVFTFIFSEAFVWILKYDVGLNRERFRAILIDPTNWTQVSEHQYTINYDSAFKAYHWWWEKTPAEAKQAWIDSVTQLDPSLAGYANNAFSSFPSGHSSLAACSMAICFLPCCYDKAGNKEWKGYIVWLAALAVTFIVMFSRVGAGAHFLSDTTIGFFFGVIPSFVLGMIMFKIPKVSDYLQNMNINGQWFEFVFVPTILPIGIWIVSKALSWA